MMYSCLRKSKVMSGLASEKGNFLVVALLLSSVLMVLLLSAIRTIQHEQLKTKMDYYNFTASSVAESGIGLAKSEMFSGRSKSKVQEALKDSSPTKLTFNYGSNFFPVVSGKNVSCQVTSYLEKGKIFIESTAMLTEKTRNEFNKDSPYRVISKKKVKTLLEVTGFPAKIRTVWQVSE